MAFTSVRQLPRRPIASRIRGVLSPRTPSPALLPAPPRIFACPPTASSPQAQARVLPSQLAFTLPRQLTLLLSYPPTSACLKDLQRFLRRDKPDTRQAYRLLGPYNLVKTNLVPLINTYPNDQELLYNACETLTPPALLPCLAFTDFDPLCPQ